MAANDNANAPLSLAGAIVLAILAGLLAAAVWYAVRVWRSMAAVHMSAFGWTFLVLGAVVTFGLGAGLMFLVFYSSRHDMDR